MLISLVFFRKLTYWELKGLTFNSETLVYTASIPGIHEAEVCPL